MTRRRHRRRGGSGQKPGSKPFARSRRCSGPAAGAGGRGVYRSFDVLSPWTVGRFRNDRETDRFYEDEVEPDLRETRRLGVDYMPVVFPGFSWHNMRPDAAFNRIPRRGGRFYWRQVERAIGLGATMLYGAMFDEVDEGTAMFKVAASSRDVPKDARFVTLDADGERLPSDWYLRLARETQKRLASARRRYRQRISHFQGAPRTLLSSIRTSGRSRSTR